MALWTIAVYLSKTMISGATQFPSHQATAGHNVMPVEGLTLARRDAACNFFRTNRQKRRARMVFLNDRHWNDLSLHWLLAEKNATWHCQMSIQWGRTFRNKFKTSVITKRSHTSPGITRKFSARPIKPICRHLIGQTSKFLIYGLGWKFSRVNPLRF